MSLLTTSTTTRRKEVAREAGIIRHTIEHSLGFHGRVERLPSAEVMELNTMCGHGRAYLTPFVPEHTR